MQTITNPRKLLEVKGYLAIPNFCPCSRCHGDACVKCFCGKWYDGACASKGHRPVTYHHPGRERSVNAVDLQGFDHKTTGGLAPTLIIYGQWFKVVRFRNQDLSIDPDGTIRGKNPYAKKRVSGSSARYAEKYYNKNCCEMSPKDMRYTYDGTMVIVTWDSSLVRELTKVIPGIKEKGSESIKEAMRISRLSGVDIDSVVSLSRGSSNDVYLTAVRGAIDANINRNNLRDTYSITSGVMRNALLASDFEWVSFNKKD